MLFFAEGVIDIIMVFGPNFNPHDFTPSHGEKGFSDEIMSFLVGHVEFVFDFSSLVEVDKLSIVKSGAMHVVNYIGWLAASLKLWVWLLHYIL